MMLGPVNFINGSISGKSYEAAKKEVQSLWKEIRRLKKVMEEEPDSDEMMICPMPPVKISTYRDYLEAARDYFEARGWEYELTKEEAADKEFNDRLKDVQSIEISYGGFLCGGEDRTLTFDGQKIITDSSYVLRVPSEEEMFREFYKGMTKDELLEELKNIHMGEWKKWYEDICVMDGIRWSVVFKYLDGKKRKFSGSNRFPYNFYGFLDVMQMEAIE
ncbi:MAG: hypothetical protein J5372_02740 [Lachnospiraceae bacterium]|nr:hypothetical protein [Lachnospiraceae bacterium]